MRSTAEGGLWISGPASHRGIEVAVSGVAGLLLVAVSGGLSALMGGDGPGGTFLILGSVVAAGHW